MTFFFRRTAPLALALACATQTPVEPAPSATPEDTGSGATGGTDMTGTGGADMTGTGGTDMPATGGTDMTGTGGTVMTGAGGTEMTGTGGATAGGAGGTPAATGGSSTGGTGGTDMPTTGGAGGSTGGTAPAAGTGGTDTSSGGTTATGGTGGSTGGTDTGTPIGYAELSVPFTAYSTSQGFEIYLSGAVDFSAATVSVVMRKVSGKAGGVQVVVKDGTEQSYAWAQNAWTGISDMLTTDWTTLSFNVASPSSTDTNETFDPAQVKILTIQVNAGDPWYSDPPDNVTVDQAALMNPTVLDIDSITVTGASTGPWTFDSASNAALLVPNVNADAIAGKYAVEGSTVTWKSQ